MNPSPHPKFQALRQQVESMQLLLKEMRSLTNEILEQFVSAQGNLKVQIKSLERSHLKIQELFQTQILAQISPSEESNIPHYVEINKQLRLLGADLNLLKTARQPETLNQRIDKACDRLTLLLIYCDALVEN